MAEAYKLVSMNLPKSMHTFNLEGVIFSDLNALEFFQDPDTTTHCKTYAQSKLLLLGQCMGFL